MPESELKLPDIFSGSAEKYLDYAKRFQPAWEYMERPMWQIILERYNLKEAGIIDVGSGTGKMIDLLVAAGASYHEIFAIEPNETLVKFLFDKYRAEGVGCIIGSSHDLSHELLQHQEYDLVTANMVVNHLTTAEYDQFVESVWGMLKPDGILVYTVPNPEEKAKKHGFPYDVNSIVVEELSPWGEMVKYHHRSAEYQAAKMQKLGFRVKQYLFGYEDFVEKKRLELGEAHLGKNLHGYKRFLFEAQKIA